MTHADAGIGELFDGKTTSTVRVGKKSIVSNYEIYYSNFVDKLLELPIEIISFYFYTL